jgi:hypothetical protein
VNVVQENSRRLDVTGPPDTAPDPGAKYITVNKEEYLPFMIRARELAKDVLGR